jgi:hypothetical protein
MPVTTNCTITEVSRRATYSRDGLTVTRVMDVTPYSAAAPLAYEMLGGPRVLNGRVYRRLPERDPWLKQCFCESIDSEGMGKFDGFNGEVFTPSVVLASKSKYDFARLTVTYKTPEKNTPEEEEAASGENSSEQAEIELATQSWDFSSTSLTLPLSQFKTKYGIVNTTAQQQGTNGIKVFPKIDYTLARTRLATRPIVAITSLVGRVNKNKFNLGVAIWPPETLRFEGANISQRVTMDGFKYFDINYKFTIMPIYDLVATTQETEVAGSGSSAPSVITPSAKKMDFVGWNRVYIPARGCWDYLVEVADETRKIYRYDTEYSQGFATGFSCLFHPRAY